MNKSPFEAKPDKEAFVCFSKEIELTFSHHASSKSVCEASQAFLMEVSRALKEEGCPLIGHLKILLDRGGGGHFFISLTSYDQIPDCKGEMAEDLSGIRLTVNAIVYGLDQSILSSIMEKSLRNLQATISSIA